MSFFEAINYAASHEDGRSEQRALALGHDARVLCITGSGARVLDLLIAGPRELVAIDVNPAQTHLLALKLAVLQTMSYEEHLRFLGLLDAPHSARSARSSAACAQSAAGPTHDSHRAVLYARTRPLLSNETRAFWDRHGKAIERGVFYAGRWERFLRVMVAPAAFVRRQLIDELFVCGSLEQQAALWRERWNTPGWDRYLRVLANRWAWTKLVREPGMRHIPGELDIVAYIKGRFDRAAETTLFRDSPWCWLIFRGFLSATGPLPPHLSREHFVSLREHAHRVTAVTDSLSSYLARDEAGTFSAYSVSDFGSYADDRAYAETWRAIAHRAAPEARVCERQFLVPRDPTRIAGLGFVRDASLEATLTRADSSVVYDLIVGTL
jgi:S-adenosylmethionine-diacylglycerol 3-amino-3-carboxypropyl transferase